MRHRASSEGRQIAKVSREHSEGDREDLCCEGTDRGEFMDRAVDAYLCLLRLEERHGPLNLGILDALDHLRELVELRVEDYETVRIVVDEAA